MNQDQEEKLIDDQDYGKKLNNSSSKWGQMPSRCKTGRSYWVAIALAQKHDHWFNSKHINEVKITMNDKFQMKHKYQTKRDSTRKIGAEEADLY